jgi:hypothetical protein
VLVAPLDQDNVDQNAQLKRLLDCLDQVCEKIAEKFNLYDMQGRARKAFVLDTLMKYNCYGCIAKVLSEPKDSRVDAIYIENHALAVNLLVEMLRYQSNVNGLPFNVAGEFNGNFGRMDIVIIPTRNGVILEAKDREIIVEVKTGKTFSYVQLFRYLFGKPNAIIVLWRVVEGQVIVLEGKKLQKLLMLCAAAAIHRGLSILNVTNVTCNHHLDCNKKATIDDPQKLVEDFLESLREGLSKVVETVLSLLNQEGI